MYLWACYEEKNVIFCILKLNPDPLVRGTDPGNRIRTKMLRIPNTGPFPSPSPFSKVIFKKQKKPRIPQNADALGGHIQSETVKKT
jgi:hypothetical protein